jgi:transposase
LTELSFEKFTKKELILLVETLIAKVDTLQRKVDSLEIKVTELEEENRFLKIKKTSSNSSIPPSNDLAKAKAKVKPNQSLRGKTGRKKGGQHGHKGHTLEMISNPDFIKKYAAEFCNSCGSNLENVAEYLAERRQVIDIPPINSICTEHQVFAKNCSCGKVCRGQFPENINAPMQYGPFVESLVSYFSVRQYLPFKRMQECFSDIFGLNLSQGSIANLLSKFAKKAEPIYQRIKANILASDVIGVDETGAVVNGEKGWYWIWQNPLNTFISFSKSRGFDTIANLFPKGFLSSIIVSDCWAAQLKVDSQAKQLCISHLTRELNFFLETLNDPWAKKIKRLLLNAIDYKKEIIDYSAPNEPREKLSEELNELLKEIEFSRNKKLKAFQKRLKKHQDKILPFLYYEDVPPDNNASERGIRNIKVKQKISGQFVSIQKAMDFAVVRSVFETIIKNGGNIFQVSRNIAQLSVPE